MKFEIFFLIAECVISILSLIFIPKSKWFEAQFIFLFAGMPTWILGLMAVQFELLEYPYRELSDVNRTSFIFEYLVLPIMCIHFYIHYPKLSSKVIKCLYYFGITLLFTGIEYFVEKYTDILNYKGWQLYWTFISVGFVLWFVRKTTLWFFNLN